MRANCYYGYYNFKEMFLSQKCKWKKLNLRVKRITINDNHRVVSC